MAIATLAVRLTAQIAEFQSEFREATKTAQNFQKEFSTVASRVGSLASGIVAGIGVAGITNFIRQTTNAASNIVDLSNKLGISIEAVQKLQFVASQTGTTVEAFSRGIFQLGNNLATGDKSTVAGIQKLNLSLSDLQRLSPEDKFNKVATAISGLTSVQERNLRLTQIFGTRIAQELAKAVDEYDELIKRAPVAGDAQVKALEKAGDKVDEFYTKLRNMSIQGLGEVITASEKAEKPIFRVSDAIRESGLAALAGANHFDIFRLALERVAGVDFELAPKLPKAPGSITQPGLAPVEQDFAAILKISKEVEAGTDKIFQNARKSTDAYTDSVKRLRDELSGAALQAEVKKLSDAFNSLTLEQRQTPEILQRVGEAAEELRLKGARLGPTLTIVALETGHFAKEIRTVSDGLPPAIADIGRLGFSIDQLVDPLIASSKAAADMDAELRRLADNAARTGGFFATVPAQAQEVTKKVKETRVEFGELSRALAQLSQITGGALDGLARFVSLLDVADKSSRQLATGFDQLSGENRNIVAGLTNIAAGAAGVATAFLEATKSGNAFQKVLSGAGIGAQIGGQLGGGIGAAIGAGIGAIAGGIRAAFTKESQKVNDLRDEFLLTFGRGGLSADSGFHTLARELHELGAAGDQLFQRLINAKKVDEFTAAMNAVNEALGRQRERLGNATAILAEYGLTWEDTGQKFRNANLAAQFEALHEKTLILKEIGVDHNLILEKQASEYSKLLQAALRTGTEIPIAFKPILQDLLTAGKLLREDGTAFDDLGDVTWAKTLTQGFRDVTKAIYDLRDAIVGGVGGALDDLSRRRIQVPIGFDVGEIVLPDLPHLARGGVVRRPTLALVGESGPEAVVPLNQLGTAQAGTSTIIIEADGRQFAEIVVPYIPGVVKRYGLV